MIDDVLLYVIETNLIRVAGRNDTVSLPSVDLCALKICL
jgi:hypothetical protein